MQNDFFANIWYLYVSSISFLYVNRWNLLLLPSGWLRFISQHIYTYTFISFACANFVTKWIKKKYTVYRCIYRWTKPNDDNDGNCGNSTSTSSNNDIAFVFRTRHTTDTRAHKIYFKREEKMKNAFSTGHRHTHRLIAHIIFFFGYALSFNSVIGVWGRVNSICQQSLKNNELIWKLATQNANESQFHKRNSVQLIQMENVNLMQDWSLFHRLRFFFILRITFDLTRIFTTFKWLLLHYAFGVPC